jgi:hypothetical protein
MEHVKKLAEIFISEAEKIAEIVCDAHEKGDKEGFMSNANIFLTLCDAYHKACESLELHKEYSEHEEPHTTHKSGAFGQ